MPEELCACGKEGIFIKHSDEWYNNDTNTQYCGKCWAIHCDAIERSNILADIREE